jgi:hypothetical protein
MNLAQASKSHFKLIIKKYTARLNISSNTKNMIAFNICTTGHNTSKYS